MNKKLHHLFILYLFFSFLVFNKCTDNPFFGETEISANTIRGKVNLDNKLKPEGIFVWFEALDINTRTDENGQFTLNIPPPNKQPGEGIDGIYDLYFYVSNYRLHSVKIAFLNGNVQFSEQSLNNDGELNQTIVLHEILRITTSISSGQVSEAGEKTTLAIFTVNAKQEPILVTCNFSNELFPGDPEYMSGYLIDSNGKFMKFLKKENRSSRTSSIQVTKTGGELKPVLISLDPGELTSGEYEVVPYLFIRQDNLPSGLLESIGSNVQNYSLSFLKVPMKISNNKFQI
jgi:hypothetical protein